MCSFAKVWDFSKFDGKNFLAVPVTLQRLQFMYEIDAKKIEYLSFSTTVLGYSKKQVEHNHGMNEVWLYI